MEIYDACHLCGKWDDLTIWGKGKGIYLCMTCANELSKRKSHHSYAEIFIQAKKEREKSNG